MKKKLLNLLLTALLATSLVACGNTKSDTPVENNENKAEVTVTEPKEESVDESSSTTEEGLEDSKEIETATVEEFDPELSDEIPSNDMEARVGKTSFKSYDEIISLLEGDEAYALVKVKGYDGDVLLVASGCYDNCDGENMAAIDATPYTKKSTGLVTADSCLYSQGTAYPISIDNNGLIFCFGAHEINEYCYGENGSDDVGLMVMKYIAVEEFDNEGYPTKLSGFYRESDLASVINNEAINYDENDVDEFNKTFEDFENAKIINFTSLDGRKAAPLN